MPRGAPYGGVCCDERMGGFPKASPRQAKTLPIVAFQTPPFSEVGLHNRQLVKIKRDRSR